MPLEKQHLVNACDQIQTLREQDLYRAIVLYRVFKDFKQADEIFKSEVQSHPYDIEIRLENIKFLRQAIKQKQTLARKQSPQSEAR